jgi:hypothetical protein
MGLPLHITNSTSIIDLRFMTQLRKFDFHSITKHISQQADPFEAAVVSHHQATHPPSV